MIRILPRRLASIAALAALAVGTLPVAPAFAAEVRDISAFACLPEEVPDPGFEDTADNPHEAAIHCVVFYDIARGTSATEYAPARDVNRAQMATFIRNVVVAGGVELPSEPANAFTDDDGSVHHRAINQLAAIGVVSGTSETTYSPERAVRRDQMATFLNNAYEAITGTRLSSEEDAFTDDDDSVHEANVNAIAAAGLAAGTSATTYGPGLAVRRDQMASFVARELDLLVEEGAISVPRGTGDNVTVLTVPELLRVEAISVTQVRFVFDETISDTVVTEAFALYGVTADRAEASSVAREGSSAVIATFTEAAVAQSTVAGVAAGAVQDADANLSPEGRAGLQDVDLTPGTTVAPDLTDVSVRQNAADFSFDEPAFAVNNTGYHLVLTDGTVLTATDATPTGNGTTTHTVAFELAAGDVDRVAFGYVDAGTVSDAEGDGNALNGTEGEVNVLQTVDVSATGTTDLPDLVDAAVTSDTTVTFRFDENVTRRNDQFGRPAGGFQVYTVDGRVLTPASVEDTGAATFTATFAADELDPVVSGAQVLPGTVQAADTDNNAAQELGFPVSFVAGDTAAPELVSAQVVEDPETTDRRVSFTFDAPVASLEDETQLKVYARDGASASFVAAGTFPPTTSGCAVDAENAQVVVCTVNQEEEPELWAFLADARIATAERGTVTTDDGFANAEGAAILRGTVTNPEPEPEPSA